MDILSQTVFHYFFIMISVAQIDGALSKELGSFFSTEAHQETDRIRYINAGVRAICIARNFPFNRYVETITTISIQTQYTIPYQIETFAILNSEGEEANMYDFTDYYLLKDKSNAIGIWEDKLVTSMVGTFTILYRGFPPIITSLTGVVDIPEHFYDVLLVKSLAYGYADNKQFDKMGSRNDTFDRMIKAIAIRNDNRKPRQSVRMGEDNIGGWDTPQ